MPTRVSVRRVGAVAGKLAGCPDSLAELLALATKKLKLDAPATHIFTAGGDEIDDDDDVQLIREDEVLYVSCGEDFGPPTAVPAAAAPPEPAVVEEAPAAPASPPAPPAPVEAPAPAPAVAEAVPAAEGFNPFEIFSLDEEKAAAAETAMAAAPAAAPRLSVEATRDLVQAQPRSAFSLMVRGGASDAFILNLITEHDGKGPNREIYAFSQDPDRFLEAREAPAEQEVLEGAEPPPPPPLLMGEWEKVPLPAAEAKKKKGAKKMALKPHLSAMKKVFASRQKRNKSVSVWQYPSDKELMAQRVDWHDFKSVVSEVNNIFLKQEADAEKASKRAMKPTSDDQGGVMKLKAEFEKSEWKRGERSNEIQKKWSSREADIGTRLRVACDRRERAPSDQGKEAAALEVDVIEEERRNFFDARAKEKLQLDEARKDAKRKFEADLETQRTYNRTVKGESRKKFKEALAGEAASMDVDAEGAGPSSLSVVSVVASAARARAPPAPLSHYYEQERLASLVDESIAMLPPSK